MGWNGELKKAKLPKSLNHPNVVNFKSVCYQPLANVFDIMCHLVFPRLEQFVKLVDWMGFLGFSIIFRLKSSSKNKFRFDWWAPVSS